MLSRDGFRPEEVLDMKSSGTDDRSGAFPDLDGLRVLVVEDRGLIASQLAQILCQAGCTVVGPAATLMAGLDLAQREGNALDAALLDIDLRGEPVYLLAEALRASEVPFMFLTGYGQMVIPETWRDAPRLEKPVNASSLRNALQRLVSGRPVPTQDQRRFAGDPPKAVRRAWEMIRRQRDLIMEGQIRAQAGSPGFRKLGG
jgi:CheY-like chemotaxis protein